MDAAGETGAGGPTRPAVRPHGYTGAVPATPANRDRSGVRYVLEEEPS
jgi:hypothetical protein